MLSDVWTNVQQKKKQLAAWSYLVNTLYFRNIGDSVGSVFVIVGFNFSLENEKTK